MNQLRIIACAILIGLAPLSMILGGLSAPLRVLLWVCMVMAGAIIARSYSH